MINDIHNLLEKFALEVQGATCEDIMSILDRWIEDGEVDGDWFRDNEMEILRAIDTEFFTCNGCDWTMPISEQDERGEWHCRQCCDEAD